jgi:tetratricopeptide (TPR) repeat protein
MILAIGGSHNLPIAEIFTATSLLGACISGLIGNRTDAALTWIGSAGYNRLTGEASSEAPVILTAMHKCFVLSVAAMARACDSVGGDPVTHFSRRALEDFAKSKDLRNFDAQRHQIHSDLLEEQVRTIFGQQGRTPREMATDRAIAIIEAGMGTALTAPLRDVFRDGHGRYRGWAEQFELFFAAEVSANQKLANILSLDRQNEMLVLMQDHGATIADMRRDFEDWFQRADLKLDEILAAIAALHRSEQQEQFAPAAAIAVIEEAARSGDLTDRQKSKIASIYGEYLMRTTSVPEQFIATNIDSIQREDGNALLEVALRDLAGEDRRKVVAEREAELENDVTALAIRYRELAGFAALDSVEHAVRLFARATELDPTDFWTWIELARLHIAAGSLPQARRAADAARQHAKDDREASVAETELGGLCVHERQLQAALVHFHAALRADEALVARDPDNAELQRDLSVSHNNLGDVARAQGDLVAAASAYRANLSIAEQLAARDPGNAEWQRDLAVSYSRLGNVARAQGDLIAAASAYRATLSIAEQLIARDPGNVEWQRDMAVSHNKLGDVARAQGDFFAAANAYGASLGIREQLAARDQGHAEWQRDLFISHAKLAQLAEDSLDMATAVAEFESAEAILLGLLNRVGEHPGFLRDLAQVRADLARLRATP